MKQLRRALLPLVVMHATAGLTTAQSLEFQHYWWLPDRQVEVMVADTVNEVLYLAGDFDNISPYVPNGAIVDMNTTEVRLPGLAPDGAVYTCVADGAGGWYIGGEFTAVGGYPRANVARINSDGTLHPWNPGTDDQVSTFMLDNGRLFVGGEFDAVDGQPRSGVCSFWAATGGLEAWAPQVPGNVGAFARTADVIYIGGSFSQVNGEQHLDLAALDRTTGAVLPWAPSTNGAVGCIAVHGDALYFGGTFWQTGGQFRDNLAAVDLATGDLLPWAPNPNGSVTAMLLKGDTLFVGGGFEELAGGSAQLVAALSVSDGSLFEWSGAAGLYVTCFALHEGMLLVGGYQAGGTPQGILALDAITGEETDWRLPFHGNAIHSIAISGDHVYFGGLFSTMGGVPRHRIAAMDMRTGLPTDWGPVLSGGGQTVFSMILLDSTLLIGGYFSEVNGEDRWHVAELRLTDASLTPWAPVVDGPMVRTMAVNDTAVFLGGLGISQVNGVEVHGLAAVSRSPDAAVYAWPATEDDVDLMLLSGDTLYVTTFGPGGLYALDIATGEYLFEFEGYINSTAVSSLEVVGDTLFAAGLINDSSGVVEDLLLFDRTTGALLLWDAGIEGIGIQDCHVVHARNDRIYLGGAFNTVGDQPQDQLAILDRNTLTTVDWDPQFMNPGTVLAVEVTADRLFAGGSMQDYAGTTRDHFAVYGAPDCTGAPLHAAPGDACDDADPTTINDTWTAACQCVGQLTIGMVDPTVTSPNASVRFDPVDRSFRFDEPLTGRIQDLTGKIVRTFRKVDRVHLDDLVPGIYILTTDEGRSARLMRQ